MFMLELYSDRMRKGQFDVQLVQRADIADFVEANHYSGSINGVMSSYCFALIDNGKLIGAMIYGPLGMANAWKKYAENQNEVIELRRLCLVDQTPKNSESFFIGQTLRWLKRNTSIKVVVSYADPNYGHEGTIYKATNFEHIGMTSKGKVIWWNGKKYHDKAIRTKYKGKLKPFASRLLSALENGEATFSVQEPKHIYKKVIR
jgi:hypothetical protein